MINITDWEQHTWIVSGVKVIREKWNEEGAGYETVYGLFAGFVIVGNLR